MAEIPQVHWTEAGEARTARWHSERGARAAEDACVVVDDRITADDAYGQACQGVALLWRGDFQNARQMLNVAGEPRRAAPASAGHAGGVRPRPR